MHFQNLAKMANWHLRNSNTIWTTSFVFSVELQDISQRTVWKQPLPKPALSKPNRRTLNSPPQLPRKTKQSPGLCTTWVLHWSPLCETVFSLCIHSLETTDLHHASPNAYVQVLTFGIYSFNFTGTRHITHLLPDGILSPSPSRSSLWKPTTTREPDLCVTLLDHFWQL